MVGASESWWCGLCGRRTPPMVGGWIAGSARHRCRACERTVCDACSIVPHGGVRTCQACYLQSDAEEEVRGAPREKYVFLVRHAQSTWNRHIDTVKTLRSCSPGDVSIKDVLSRAAHLMTKEVWHRDHPLSEEGARQAVALRQRVAALRQREPALHIDKASPSTMPAPRLQAYPVVERPTLRPCGCLTDGGTERERRYYDAFLAERQQIYCSPLLRALQTAHLALPEEDGWGSIKLLKDARERFSFVFERDCLGTGVGAHIVDRAVHMLGQDLDSLRKRVDAADCESKWWSDEPESDAQLEARLVSLWHHLMEEDCSDSIVLVTHSNLIKALLMRFGGVDEDAGDTPEGGLSDRRCTRKVPMKEESLSSTDGADIATLATTMPPTPRASGEPGAPGNVAAVAAAGPCAGRPSSASASSPSSLPAAEDEVYIPETVGTVTGETASCASESDDAGDCEWATANAPWQVVEGGPEALRRLKVERLQNCGVLGLRCVLEEPLVTLYPEVDGWVDVDAQGARRASDRCRMDSLEKRWVAKDALLMFDSSLVR